MKILTMDQNYKINVFNTKFDLISTLSYVIDWLIYTVMLIVASNWNLIYTTKTSEFSIRDISIMYSYIPENETYAPLWFLLILIVLLPLIIIIICSIIILGRKNKKLLFWEIHSAILGSFGCCCSQLLLIVIMKNVSLVPRPDLLSRCEPTTHTAPHTDHLSTIDICLNTNLSLIKDGFKSFPSGHSSTIFASQTFLGLFLIGKMKISGISYFSWKFLLSIMFPLIISFKVSLSRISDHRHKIIDVLFGSFIGVLFGLLFYLLYFDSPFKQLDYMAYLPRKVEIGKTTNNLISFKISSFDLKSNVYIESIDDTVDRYETKNIPFGYSTLPLKPKKIHNTCKSHKTLGKKYLSTERYDIFYRKV